MAGRFFLVAGAAALLAVGVSAASADTVSDRFKFEFHAGGNRLHIGTDLHSSHYTDFNHYNDYYVQGFIDNPRSTSSCSEQVIAGADGRPIKRITCIGKPSSPFGQ